jgi:uncharacterized integral membrane protein
MPLRTILIVLVVGGLAVFAALNWGAFTAPTTLRLGVGTVEAPLGLILLGFTGVLTILFLVFVTYLQTSVLIEGRRYARELQAQRQLAEQSEASRYSQLRQFVEVEIDKLVEQGERGRAETQARLDQLDRELRVIIEQSGNSLAASIGELEDFVQRRLGVNDREKSA